MPPAQDTDLDRRVHAAGGAHPGGSGFALLSEGPEAFVARVRSLQLAERSLDVQTYLLHSDETGVYLISEMLAAADRGVRVRLLVDDMAARSRSRGFAALHAHPNVQVRMFNPYASRRGTASFLGETVDSFHRLNHRMHNKTWIADNRIAIVGGRNIGDEYFEASEQVNFVDLDLFAIGPVVEAVSASFDRYWNAALSYPMDVLDPDAVSPEALAELRLGLEARTRDAGDSRYAQALASDGAVRRLLRGELEMEWTSEWRMLSDDPHKVKLDRDDPAISAVVQGLGELIAQAEERVSVVSPYFIPGERGTASLVGLVAAGLTVEVLTNSLAANDVAAVHGGYSRWREPLLEGGVSLWEMKPTGSGQVRSSLTGSSGASLHTKALVVDGEWLFVGSYNLDPRSTSLNTEQGLVVRSPVLGQRLAELFARGTSPERSWAVRLEDGELRWDDAEGSSSREPQASWWRRFQAWFTRSFNMDSQL